MTIETQPNSIRTTPLAPNDIYHYYGDLDEKSGFIADVESVIRSAENYMNQRVSEYKVAKTQSKLAIVLDIDETCLSNYPAIKKDNFANNPAIIDVRYHETNAPAIAPVQRFYQKARQCGIDLFFVSARMPLNAKDDLRPFVIENLQKAGFDGWTGLYMPQVEEFNMPKAEFKTQVRKLLTEQKGYQIILNVGDQDCDFEGGYAEYGVKIPNPLYGTPHRGMFAQQQNNRTLIKDEKTENAITYSKSQ